MGDVCFYMVSRLGCRFYFIFFQFSFFFSVLINFMMSGYVINNIYILEEKKCEELKEIRKSR
jgi:hypothetical protein